MNRKLLIEFYNEHTENKVKNIDIFDYIVANYLIRLAKEENRQDILDCYKSYI